MIWTSGEIDTFFPMVMNPRIEAAPLINNRILPITSCAAISQAQEKLRVPFHLHGALIEKSESRARYIPQPRCCKCKASIEADCSPMAHFEEAALTVRAIPLE